MTDEPVTEQRIAGSYVKRWGTAKAPRFVLHVAEHTSDSDLTAMLDRAERAWLKLTGEAAPLTELPDGSKAPWLPK
jgi:hypothetical protein